MSAAERALDGLKALFTYREQMTALRADLKELGESLRRVAESHAELRDRVSRIEGFLGRFDRSGDNPPKIK